MVRAYLNKGRNKGSKISIGCICCKKEGKRRTKKEVVIDEVENDMNRAGVSKDDLGDRVKQNPK